MPRVAKETIAEDAVEEESPENEEEIEQEIENIVEEPEFSTNGNLQEEGEEKSSPFGEWSAQTAERKGFKLLLYGPPGAGKTRMSATFPRPLFLDLENGLRTTLKMKPVLRFPADPKEEIASFAQVGQFYNLVKKAANPQFDTIVIDSLNELQVLVMNHVVGKYKQATRQYDDQFTQADYGKANRDLLKTIRLFLQLPYHIVFTAVETPRDYPEQQVFPKLKGKEVWPDFQRIIEMIGYCHVVRGSDGKPEHVVSFHLSPTHIAKDRLNIPIRDIPNDYESLAKYANT